jgi:hypothetical protein
MSDTIKSYEDDKRFPLRPTGSIDPYSLDEDQGTTANESYKLPGVNLSRQIAMAEIASQREEILRAFLAKFQCEPEDVEQIITLGDTKITWHIQRRIDVTEDLNVDSGGIPATGKVKNKDCLISIDPEKGWSSEVLDEILEALAMLRLGFTRTLTIIRKGAGQ